MSQPVNDQGTQARPPAQSPLSEAVEQAGGAARGWLRDLEGFARQEADALTSGNYGLSNLATAPVRLFGVLVRNAIGTASTVSDNLALLSLTGRFVTATAEREFRVSVDVPAARVTKLQASELVGRLTNYRIPADKLRIDPDELAADGPVRVTVHCAAAPSDTYVGSLSSDDDAMSPQEIQVAIDDFGEPVT